MTEKIPIITSYILQFPIILFYYVVYTYFYLSIRFFNSCRRLPETKHHSSLFLH